MDEHRKPGLIESFGGGPNAVESIGILFVIGFLFVVVCVATPPIGWIVLLTAVIGRSLK